MKQLSTTERMQVFKDLVATQDGGTLSVTQARRLIARRYGLADHELGDIEKQGLEEDWPPLD
jgi:hypothetical protein